MRPLVLYLHTIAFDSCQQAKLAGMRRYAAVRGWQVEAVRRESARLSMIPRILERRKPAGCIVEPVVDPVGEIPTVGGICVIRGGSKDTAAWGCRNARRNVVSSPIGATSGASDYRESNGARLVLEF